MNVESKKFYEEYISSLQATVDRLYKENEKNFFDLKEANQTIKHLESEIAIGSEPSQYIIQLKRINYLEGKLSWYYRKYGENKDER